MRIVLLTPYSRPVPGGVAHYLAGLRTRLASNGHKVHVVSMEGEPEAGVTIIRQHPILRWRTLSRILDRIRPDVVHVHGHWSLLYPALWAKVRGRTRRVLFTFHTATRTRGLRRVVLGRLINKCDFVTAVSADLLAREIRRLRIRVPVAVTYPGVEPPNVGPDAVRAFRESLGLGSADRLIVTVTPLQYERKVAGLLDLLRALPRLPPSVRATHLVVLGDGIFMGQVRSLVDRLGLADRVHLVGALPDASPAYAAADVVAHVSYQDELPLALLESMAHGKPILCSPIGGVPEILDDQKEGLYVEGGPDAIARGLEQLMSDPRAARRYGEAACRRVDASWIGLHSYRQVEELYGSVRTKRVHFSVDVEEDYHLRGPTYRGVTEALPRLLDIFREEGIRASFFVTADVVRHHSDIVRRIRQEGHHVGSHGLSHQAPPFAGRCFAAQSHDIAEAVSALGPLASDPLAFRAPNFRVDATTMHALALNGVRADASLVPGRVVRRTREAPRLDFRGMPAQTYRISFARPSLLGLARILEAPVAANPFAEGSPLGLGYLNHAGVERTLEALATLPGRDVVFLIHPWEAIDYPENSSRPAWMYKGCSSDLSKLRAFLQQVKSNHATVDFPTLLTAPLSLNCRWWSPGPWASTVRRPRVLLVTNVFRPVTGGVTTYLAGLRDELSSIGFDVSLMAYPARLVRREAVRRHSPFRKLSHLAFAAACLLKVAAWRLRGDPVLVHSHGASFCLLVAYFSRWMGAVGLHTFHSPLTHPSRTLQWFAPRLDALLYVSEETRRLYEESNQLFHDRVGIVPGGVYMPAEHSFEKDERAGLRRRLNLGPKDFAILFVGRVVRDKGVHVAIEAMPRVLEANQHAQLIIAGPLGPSREDERYVRELEDCVRRRGLAESVRFLGLVAEHDLHALYRAADCLVVPSVWDEPAPMVVAEAMSEGLPVAASAVGGLPSQVLDRRNGLLFSPGNSESLARCLLSLMEDETLRSSLGSEARRWIEDHASVEMLGEIHSRIYQGLWREARFP